jgi:hypothetical protein
MPAQDVNIVGTIPEGSEVAAKFVAAAKARIKSHLDNADTYLTLEPLKVVLTEAARELRDADKDWYYVGELFNFIDGLTEKNAHLFLHYLGYCWVDCYYLDDDKDIRCTNAVDFIEGDLEGSSKKEIICGLVKEGVEQIKYSAWSATWDTFEEDVIGYAKQLGYVVSISEGGLITDSKIYLKNPAKSALGRWWDKFCWGYRYE